MYIQKFKLNAKCEPYWAYDLFVKDCNVQQIASCLLVFLHMAQLIEFNATYDEFVRKITDDSR